MKILLVHQNFPGQFKYIAPALVSEGHEITAIFNRETSAPVHPEIILKPYTIKKGNAKDGHPWVTDFESKIIRGEAVANLCLELKGHGYYPDVIFAHPGWGESLFLKQVWPTALVKIYLEFFYHSTGYDVGFDPEFRRTDFFDSCRVELKNATPLLQLEIADAAVCPTNWQASTFPPHARTKIKVLHDGIDTQKIAPGNHSELRLNDDVLLLHDDEVVTFVSRSLEPYRGYHVFMRSLPELFLRKPNAKVVIIGREGVSYGALPSGDLSWKEIFRREVFLKLTEEQQKRVYFLGNVPHDTFIKILQISKAHVYLTYPFVLSWSLLEAMSIGCKIIASDTPPVKELITHMETGMLVDFFDIHNLARTIADTLDGKYNHLELGTNARSKIVKEYDLKSICIPRLLSWVTDLS